MRAFIIGLMLFALPAHAADCGAADAPCEVDSGTYHILLPEGGVCLLYTSDAADE